MDEPSPSAPAAAPADSESRPHLHRHVLYPNHYTWYVLVSSLDLIMTNTVMHHFGAREVNTIADMAIRHFGFWGLIALKFATVVLVVFICEHVGRKRPLLGKKIASWAVAISAVPVVVAVVQVVLHAALGAR
jgi:hypothetical protein